MKTEDVFMLKCPLFSLLPLKHHLINLIMKTINNLLLLVLIPVVLFSCTEEENPENDENQGTYYINTQEDFEKWNNTNFPAGSKVLFASGATFKGQFNLRGSGTAESPNLAASYNQDTGEIYEDWTDDKARIDGEGTVQSALKLSNGSFWTINNIEVTNTDGSTGQQGEILGINVVATYGDVVQDITVKNCYVHHVNGEVGGKYTGGIHVYVLGDSPDKTIFHKVTIENNIVSHVGGVGIANQSSYGNIVSGDFHPWTEYVVRGNRVEHTGRNGIIVRYSIDPLVEYNIAAHNSRFDVGHSIFNFNTINCVVQFNEAYGNVGNDMSKIDRGGFDCDFNSRNTIYQYNYSHDNHWFMAIQRRDINHDVIIRYNISQNERISPYLYGFPEYEGLENVEIYNNTHYFGEGMGTVMFAAIGKDRIPTETQFKNNIFFFEDEAHWGFDPDDSCFLTNNLFYNVSPKGENALTDDPMFVNPGSGGTDIDMTDPNRLAGYKLKEGSPAIDAGVMVSNNGGKNFAGEELNNNLVNIGAF